MEDWLINYYEQTDPLKRQQMLLENKNETMSEEDKLRMKLWETRYGKGKPRKDMFVGYLMTRITRKFKLPNVTGYILAGILMGPYCLDMVPVKKKLAIEAILGLNLYEFERKPKTQQEIIFLELKNTCRKYIEISTGGRGFTSVIFGMGQLSDESIAGKIAEQISRIVFDAPHSLRMEKEFEPLQRAALEVFREIYPNREHFLKKR